MQAKDLIIGKCYVYDDDTIVVFKGIKESTKSLGMKGSFRSAVYEYSLPHIRLATPEEEHWYNQCVRQDTFVPREIAMASFKVQVGSFIFGKWYRANVDHTNKWYYIKVLNHIQGSYIQLEGETIDTDGRYHTKSYWDSGPSIAKALELGPMSDLTEIQAFLPDNHIDKIMKTAIVSNCPAYVRCYFCDAADGMFKKGNVYKTYPGVFIKDQVYLKPDSITSSITAFPLDGGVWKFEPCEGPETSANLSYEVFGKFNIGDIVISLSDKPGYRKTGDIYRVLPDSHSKVLYYEKSSNSPTPDDWRLATLEECNAYKNGVTNIKQMDSPKKIVKPVVSQFLKDDYIVTLREISGSFPKNHVFKQRETNDYLRVYKDIRGDTNGNTIAYISKASLWRYATSQEIMEYDIQNKPVDVTKISNDANSFLYDPEFTMRITMNGQSSLMMLSELLAESIPDCRPLMQNTDGLEMIGKPYDVKSLETVSKYEINNGMPKYVRVVSYGNNHFNHVLCTDNPAPSEFNNNWNQILIQCGRLTDGSFVPATREEYEAFIIENERQEAIGNKSYKDKSLREICDLCNQMFPIGSVVDFSNNGSDIYTIKEKLYINSGSYVSYVGLPIVYRLGEDTLRCSLVSKPVKTIEDLPKKAKMSDVSALTKHQEPVVVNRQKTKRSKLITINK